MKRLAVRALCTLVVFAVGCSGDGDGGNGSGGNGSTDGGNGSTDGGNGSTDGGNGNGGNGGGASVVEDAERVLSAAAIVMQAVLDEGGSVHDALAGAADAFRADPAVVTVEHGILATGRMNLVARMDSGVRLVIPIRYTEALPAVDDDGPGKSAAPAAIPQGRDALLVEYTPLDANSAALRSALERHGYRVTSVPNPTIGHFTYFSDYSLVHFATHGAYYEEDGVPHFALMGAEDPFLDDMAGEVTAGQIVAGHGMLVVPGEGDGDCASKAVEVAKIDPNAIWGVNEEFIREHNGTLANDALIYVDACESAMRENLDVLPPLAAALHGYGLRTYLGWDQAVLSNYATRAAEYVFSRMLGDTEGDYRYVQAEQPELRPFGLYDTLDGLEQRGWHGDHCGARMAHMDLNYGQQQSFLLPSISLLTVEVDIEEQTQKLDVHGDFGETRGKVMICEEDPDACTELSIDEWDSDVITADLGSDCSQCSGGVVVEVDGRRSNAHPLTEWDGSIQVQGAMPTGPQMEVTIATRFRAEIVDERNHPETDPDGDQAFAAAALGLDSRANYSFTGTFEDSAYLYEYDDSGEIEVSASPQRAFAGAVILEPAAGLASVQITALVRTPVRLTDKSTMQTRTENLMVPIPLVFEAGLAADGTLESGSTALGSLQVSWDGITPTNPPTEETAR